MDTANLSNLLDIPELQSYLEQVDHLLIDLVNVASPSIKEPALRLIKSGGKRLRPFLVIAAAKSYGAQISDSVIASCAAIELVHLGTIVHDDIIDNANIRWGVPTISSQEGESHAILTGDYLLALSLTHSLTINKHIASVIASSIVTICDGQSLEIADEYKVDRSIESYLSAIQKKTATLTSAACRVGGICGDLTAYQVEMFARYGKSFGMAFQIIDDLLDFLSTPKAMGKPVCNDIKEGVYTLPLILALKSSSSKQVRSWLGKHLDTEVDQSVIIDVLVKTGAIEATLKEVSRHNKIATSAAKELGNSKVLNGLSKLPDVYLNWALQKQTYVKSS